MNLRLIAIVTNDERTRDLNNQWGNLSTGFETHRHHFMIDIHIIKYIHNQIQDDNDDVSLIHRKDTNIGPLMSHGKSFSS